MEQICGIERVIQCHGSFATCKCIECGHEQPGKAIEKDIFEKTVPFCAKCPGEEKGVIKPSIVFFGEKLPIEFDRAFDHDKNIVDLLIVIGSSLKVSPVADVKGYWVNVDRIPSHVPQILINREALPHMNSFDIQLLGNSDAITSELARLLDWELPGPLSKEPIRQGAFPHVKIFNVAMAIRRSYRECPGYE